MKTPKKFIKGKNPTKSFDDPNYQTEQLPVYLVINPVVKQYFYSITNHIRNPKGKDNALSIFTGVRMNDTEFLRETQTEDIFVEIDNYFDSTVFDSRLPVDKIRPKDYSGLNVIDCFTFYRKNSNRTGGGRQLIGIFVYKTSCLYVTDLTHNKCGFDILSRIIEILVEKGYLKILPPLTEEVITEKVEVMLGADPEYEVLDDNFHIVRDPKNFLSDMIDDDNCFSSPIGIDGGGNQLELRPKPSDTPEGLINNIKALFKDISDVNLSVIGDHYPLGGHIHVGIKDLSDGFDVPRDLITLLDHYVGKKTINLSGVTRSHYKRLGAYECKCYGFEYRTPPSAIFANPIILRICLKIVKLVCEKFFNGGEFSIGERPSQKDYKELGMEKYEVELFYNFIRNFKKNSSYSKPITAYWTKMDKSKIIERNLPITFRDSWSSAVRNAIRINVVRKLTENKLKTLRTVTLWGFNETRGNVFWNMSNDDFPEYDIYNVVNHFPEAIYGGPHKMSVIGVSYGCRMESDPIFISALVDRIVYILTMSEDKYNALESVMNAKVNHAFDKFQERVNNERRESMIRLNRLEPEEREAEMESDTYMERDPSHE